MKQLAPYLAACCVLVSPASWAGDNVALSLHQNGTLTWSNSMPNALFSIEWAAALATNPTNTAWRDSSEAANNFWLPPGPVTLEVPMFYRVRYLPATLTSTITRPAMDW